MSKNLSPSSFSSKVSFGLISASISLLIIGLIFKFMFWPGAAFTIVLGLTIIALLLVGGSIKKILNKALFYKTLYPLLGAFFTIGVQFKIMHWPGADIMIISSMVGLSFAFLEFAFRMRKTVLSLVPALFSFSIIMMLFKIMHWPFASELLIFTFLFFALITTCVIFYRGFRLKSSTPLGSNFLVIGVLSLLYFIVECATILKFQFFGFEHFQLRLIIVSLLFLLFVFSLFIVYFKTEEFQKKFEFEFQFLQSLSIIYAFMLVIQVLVSAQA